MVVPVGDEEMGALVAMGVVGEAVPCNSKGSTFGQNKRATMGAQIVAHLCIHIALFPLANTGRHHHRTISNMVY